MLNAKLSTKAGGEGKKQQGNKSSSVAARAKSPEGGVGAARGKRTAVALLNVEEAEANKRPRTRSQTEESIPELGI